MKQNNMKITFIFIKVHKLYLNKRISVIYVFMSYQNMKRHIRYNILIYQTIV